MKIGKVALKLLLVLSENVTDDTEAGFCDSAPGSKSFLDN